jgi:Zn-dependent protease
MNFDIEKTLYTLPGVIIGLAVHEWAHAFTAWKLGDRTAKSEGRVSFNPLRHLDPLGLVFIVFMGFGWARPVRFNPENLSRPRRDGALIAAAGPVSNLILALGVLCCLKLMVLLAPGFFLPAALANILIYTAAVNLGLFVFNLLPLPPLDGSHILFSGIRMDPKTESRVLKFGALVLLLIIIIENTLRVGIIPIHIFVNKVFSVFF